MKRRVISVAVVLIVLFIFGIRLGHPDGGLSSAMGSAESGIVIYKGASEYAKGDKIVFAVETLSGDKTVTRTYIGQVITSDDKGVGVDAKSVITQINPEDIKTNIKGKMIVIVPFFGSILNVVGL